MAASERDKLIAALSCLSESAREGHASDCPVPSGGDVDDYMDGCQLCLDLQSVDDLLLALGVPPAVYKPLDGRAAPAR